MVDLDAPDALALDSQGLFRELAGSPAAMDEARAAAEAVELTFPADAVRSVALCGMGGSAIAGDIVAGALSERLVKPFGVVRDYYTPGWIGESTLTILSSYSGTTEETLTCALQATERGALCVSITSGGKLAAEYADQGVPTIPVPEGLQPRAALLRILVPVVVLLERCEAITASGADLDEARQTVVDAVAAMAPEVPTASNPAKQLAHQLLDAVPMVWGAEATAAVARRWKTQLNENAEVPAFWSELPELDHNEIVGFPGMGPLEQVVKVVSLRDERQHRQVQRRFDLTHELVRPHVAGVLTAAAEGRSPLARALDLVILGDYTSLYLALLRGLDPGPVAMIERLKGSLATTPYGRTAD